MTWKSRCLFDVATLYNVATKPKASWPNVATLNLNVATLNLNVATLLERPLAMGSTDVVTLAIMSRHQTETLRQP